MVNLLEPKPTMSGKITFDVQAASTVILRDGSIFQANAFSANPVGLYVIGVWQRDSMPKGKTAVDGTGKMIVLPWDTIEQVIHDIVRSTSDSESPQESTKMG